MRKETMGIIHALSTVFFQEGFDRETHKHGLEYWNVSEDEFETITTTTIRSTRIYHDDDRECLLNTYKNHDQWYIRVFVHEFDDYGELDDRHILVTIPVDTDRLCWGEFTKCARMIELACFPYLEDN